MTEGLAPERGERIPHFSLEPIPSGALDDDNGEVGYEIKPHNDRAREILKALNLRGSTLEIIHSGEGAAEKSLASARHALAQLQSLAIWRRADALLSAQQKLEDGRERLFNELTASAN